MSFSGCSSNETTSTMSAEERFQKAKTLFDAGDYMEAINEFTIVTLQNQGSAFADDAQFYLGECRFMRGEFLLAMFEYSTLKRNMPASPLVPEAQYKLGLSYYNLAPKAPLDQQYTKKAIDEFQAFVEYYRDHPLGVDAEEKIKELTVRLAKKEYDTARLYETMGFYKASLFYFDDVIEKYHDTEYAPLSYIGKAEVLITRKKYEEARTELNKFHQRFPNSVLRSQVDKLMEQIDSAAPAKPSVSGKESGNRVIDTTVSSRVRP